MARRNRADRDGDRKQGGLIAERLARLRRRARFVLWLEALSLAALAPLGVIAAWLIVVLLGFGGLAADIAGIVLLAVAAIWSVRRFRAPEPPAIDARIERASGFRHRPIAAIEDHPAPLGPEGMALWFVYRDKLDRLLRHARVGLPSPDLASRDPLALRALLLLGLIAAAIVAGPEAGSRLGAAIALPRLAFGPPERVAAWITPPAWTGEAPLLVPSDAKHVTALAGATLSLIVTHGGGSAPPVAIGGKAIAARRLGDHSYRARTVLHDGGRVVVGPFWNRAAAFRIDLLPAKQPFLRVVAPAQRVGAVPHVQDHGLPPAGRLTVFQVRGKHHVRKRQNVPERFRNWGAWSVGQRRKPLPDFWCTRQTGCVLGTMAQDQIAHKLTRHRW